MLHERESAVAHEVADFPLPEAALVVFLFFRVSCGFAGADAAGHGVLVGYGFSAAPGDHAACDGADDERCGQPGDDEDECGHGHGLPPGVLWSLDCDLVFCRGLTRPGVMEEAVHVFFDDLVDGVGRQFLGVFVDEYGAGGGA